MKRALALALFSTASIMSTHASAGLDICLDAYAGVDAQIRRMHFQKNFGGNVLQHKYPQANVFAGVKFNDYVGIEAGYEFTKKQRSTRTHRTGEIVFGVPIPPPDPFFLSDTFASRASSKLNGFNLNLVGFLPLFCEDKASLIGSVGVAYLKARIRNAITNILIEPIFDPDTDELIDTRTRTDIIPTQYKKRKSVLRITTGAQYMITTCFGIRGLITWNNTNKLKIRGKDPLTGVIKAQIAKPENSFQYGLGLFTSF